MDSGRPPKRRFPFFIENLISDIISPPTAPKRTRAVLINELMEEQQDLQANSDQAGTGVPKSAAPKKASKDYVKKIDDSVDYSSKFKFVKVKSSFTIEEIATDPEAMLGGIFQFCIDDAVRAARAHGIEPDQLGCTISSELLETDVWAPLRPMNANTTDALLNRFLKVAQSKKQQGINLFGKPFNISVLTVNASQLPSKRQLRGGSRRSLAPVHHRINEQCLIKIDNYDDGLCLFYALQATLIHKIGGMPRWEFFNYKHSRRGLRGRFQRDTRQLVHAVNAPLYQEEYDAEEYVPKVVDYWNEVLYAGRYRIKVFIFDGLGHYRPRFKYGAEDYDIPLLLYYTDKKREQPFGHFDGVAREGALFGKKYCLSCELTYDRDASHRASCRARCIKCSRVGPTYPCKSFPGYHQKCMLCGKSFSNNDCYRWHLQSKFCTMSKQCTECGAIYDLRETNRDGRGGHRCFARYCPNCNDFHDPIRGCFIQPLECKPAKKPCRFVAFDLETTQHQPLSDDPNSTAYHKRKHQPNFISARVACPECISSNQWRQSLLDGAHPCAVCGPHRTITFSQRPFKQTSVDHQVITPHPLVGFVKWVLYELPIRNDTVAFSHFGGRFDMVLTFRELFLEGLSPTMIRKGNKLFEMKVKQRAGLNPNVTFRDSYNLIPMSLAALVPTFELEVVDKPFFPHLCNRPENYGMNIFPTKSDYLADSMMPDKRVKFDSWFAAHGNEPFLLDEALASYCTNDVDILMHALIAFRKEFMEITRRPAIGPDGKADRAGYETPHEGIDVLRECMTIASACMRHFRANHLRPGHLAIVPERGYDSAGDNQSLLALRFMDWYAKKYGVSIQNAYSEEGEKKVGNFRLDGWIESEQRGLEIHGCTWHGCEKCFPDGNHLMPNGKTAGLLRDLNKRRIDFIRSKVGRVDIFWECEINQMLEDDPEMQKSFSSYQVGGGPLDIRAAFLGGRTGPLKLFRAVKEGEKISYYDVTSLYPFINYITAYPVGHPIVHVINEPVIWTRPEDNPYPLALLKVFIVPPRKCDLPVLPVKVDGRLCFCTCISCARKFPKGAVMDEYSCKHSDLERGWISTCTSLELDAALEEGYKVSILYRVLEYMQSNEGLFRPYIREFMTQKLHATGFEDGVAGNREAEQQFIHECLDKFDIHIDPAKMVPNKGKRALAKLALNNLWGRFALRNFGLSQTLITDDPSELGTYLRDRTIEVNDLDELTPETLLITYTKKKEWIEEHASSNIVVSLFTTSAARLLLLKAMQKVVRSPGCELLYTDTDSLIFVHPEHSNPLKLGPHLGQFTDEYPGHEILEFCSGGSKQYGLKLRRKEPTLADDTDSNEHEHVLKVRGATLNYDVIKNQGLRYETFKKSVLRFAQTGKEQTIHLLYPNFIRPSVKEGQVTSAPLRKIYRPFVGKGVVRSRDYRVLDFGYIAPSHEELD